MILKNPSFEKFSKEIIDKDKKMVVFGLSSLFMTWLPYAGKDTGIIGRALFAIDNDSTKQGRRVALGDSGFEIDIYSFEYLTQYVKDNGAGKIVILIASSYFESMIRQLDEVDELDEVECVALPLMLITHKCQSESWKPESRQQKIPKVINYCWFGRGEIPEVNKRYIEGWHKLCPDYEIKEWNEDNYDISKNRYMHEAYKAQKYGYVPDYARIDILYNNGGIYLDTDVEMIKSFDPLLTLDAFTSTEEYPFINFGGGSGAVKKHPMLKKILDFRENLRFRNEDGTYNLMTCGYYETTPIAEAGLKLDGRLQTVDGLTVFPSEYFHSESSVTGENVMTENTFSVHRFNWSWASDKQREEKLKTRENFRKILERAEKGQ